MSVSSPQLSVEPSELAFDELSYFRYRKLDDSGEMMPYRLAVYGLLAGSFYILAWLAGYQQNIFTDLVKRIMKVFQIETGGQARERQEESAPERTSEGEASPQGARHTG